MSSVWIISANGRIYDHAAAFAAFGFIDWRQNKTKYSIGDTVYIYCTAPIMRVMYRCVVEKESMPFSEIQDDRQFWSVIEEYEKSQGGNYVRLRLIEQTDNEMLALQNLKAHGLKAAPQGPAHVSEELNDYLQQNFNDFYTAGFFEDLDASAEKYYEGHVRKVLVNKYERSSIARRKCIEYHGNRCLICGMDFGKRYGEFAEGFIHVHHLKPLHEIGEEYVVDFRKDLIPVCPNCHAMIHRLNNGEGMTVEELQLILG